MEGGEPEEVVAAGVHEVSDYPGDGIAEGIEEYEDNEDAEDIEEHVGQGGAACLRVGGERGHECRDRRTDVLSHGEGGSLLEAEAGNLHVEEHEGDGHRGGRGLHEHRDECADDDEEDDGEESASLDVCQHIGDEGADVQAFGRTLQERQTHEEEAESEDKFSDALPLVVATENQRNANGEQWEGKGGNIHFEAYCRDDPGRDGGTDVGTHDDANGLREVHQLTKLTTITVVALDDWMSAVTRTPVMTPMKRFLVIAARMARRRSPANFSKPSDMIFIP